MLLIERSVKDFAQLLASGAPAPGGGAGAALNGVVGIALTNMVGSLTMGKAKYAEHADFVAGLLKRAGEIQSGFLSAIDADAQAFDKMGAVFSMPKETDSDKVARKQAMQAALKVCVVPPLDTMDLCIDALELTKQAIGKTNTTAASDLGVAAVSLKAALQGAWLNVLINIGSIDDAAFAKECRDRGEAIFRKALPLADEIYEAILKTV